MEFRSALKSATDARHRTLDTLISRWDLAQTRHYTDFLRLHSAVLLPVEDWLSASSFANRLPDWPHRRRSDALLSDLDDLSVPPLPPVPVDLDRSLPAAAGVLYVLEGSRLGGKLLLRQAGGDGSGRPAAFLTHGADGRLWQSFLTWLASQEYSSSGRHQAIDSAQRVFDHYTHLAASIMREPAE